MNDSQKYSDGFNLSAKTILILFSDRFPNKTIKLFDKQMETLLET